MPERFYWEDPKDEDTSITASVADGVLCIAVSEEQAIDSYNARVDCSIFLSRDLAELLRDFLNECYP